jgi:hypothetical protein
MGDDGGKRRDELMVMTIVATKIALTKTTLTMEGSLDEDDRPPSHYLPRII